jgi:hypothetical protein
MNSLSVVIVYRHQNLAKYSEIDHMAGVCALLGKSICNVVARVGRISKAVLGMVEEIIWLKSIDFRSTGPRAAHWHRAGSAG